MSDPGKVKLVLLPGLDGTGKLFEPLVACLPTSIDPHVISYPFDDAISIEELAYFVESKLPDGKFGLLAESYSGLVALRLVPKISSRLICIIFAGTFSSSPRPRLLRAILCFPFLVRFSTLLPNWLIRSFCLGGEATDLQCSWLRGVLKEVPGSVVLHRLRHVSQSNFTESLDIQCPGYYIQAMGDRLVPGRASEAFVKNIFGLKVLPLSAPHFMLQAKPAESANAIAGFL
jgi:pimeloyl-[acyl-carrier protein] methyl ester esterase